jgi:cell division septum initiation protein DivIVA
MQDPSARVAEILAAAEQAAEQVREEAEQRLRERIAEADRAAEHRVQAAEAEALEILGAAQEQADKIVAEGRERAREIAGEADRAAREVLRDGTELSGDVRDLSSSLRRNAELLLRDIRLAHAQMTARLDQAVPDRERSAPVEDDLDVPEFHPGR